MESGSYPSGRFQGSAYRDFIFQILEGPHAGGQASYRVPWLGPTWDPWVRDFRLLSGLELPEFNQACREAGADQPATRAALFLKLFQSAGFRLSLDGSGARVLQLQERLPLSEELELPPSSAGAPQPALKGTLAREVDRLASALGLDEHGLTVLCLEEFDQSPGELDEEWALVLRNLLAERLEDQRLRR